MTRKHTKRLRDAEYRATTQRKEWSIIERAKHALLDLAAKREINVYSVEYVAAFGDGATGIGVYMFFLRDSDLHAYLRSGATKVLEAEYLGILKQLNYPFDKYPNVSFVFDSNENVQRNYGDSYFNRLR